MDKFLDKLQRSRKVAVWGAGYLAYTSVLMLQSKGFCSVVYDLDGLATEKLKSRDYPTPDQVVAWSKTNSAPSLKFDFIEVAETPDRLFKADICLHLVAFPYSDRDLPKHNLEQLSDILEQARLAPAEMPPMVFLSAGCPGELQKYVVSKFEDYEICTAFRNDWIIEEFLSRRQLIPISSNQESAYQKLETFFELLEVKTFSLKSIREAETFENARNMLYYVISTTISQLSQAYPNVDFREMSPLLLANMDLSLCSLTAGIGGPRMPFAVENLLEGSEYSQYLSILKEAQAVNITSIISYAEYLNRNGFNKVAILGLSASGNLKSLEFSPSVNLGELLLRHGAEVGIHDPFFPPQEINEALPKAAVVDDFSKLADYEAVIVMNDHDIYKFLTQDQIDEYLNGKVKLVIDNPGIWTLFNFSEGTTYHALGDGTFSIAE